MGMCSPSGGIEKVYGSYGRSIGPIVGTPNSRTDFFDEVTGQLLQSRWYGPERWAVRDRDYDHNDSKNTHEFPHDHRWDWTKKRPRQKDEAEDSNFC
ncbi:MAG: hypothetical protein FWC02_01900 [Firmicutes bacterium]|nr:hypothetical protein [Bacillota bacterium]